MKTPGQSIDLVDVLVRSLAADREVPRTIADIIPYRPGDAQPARVGAEP